MLRYLTAIVLLTAFAAQTFQQGFVVLSYYTNPTSFAKNCENKARPMMHCNGKCQLMKKLQEEEKKQQQAPDRKLENKAEVISLQFHYPDPVAPFPTVQQFSLPSNTGKAIKTTRPLLRPPIC